MISYFIRSLKGKYLPMVTNNERNSATGGEPREEQDSTPQRLSPIRQYVPAGAEGGEPSLSSTCDEEETIEEELA